MVGSGCRRGPAGAPPRRRARRSASPTSAPRPAARPPSSQPPAPQVLAVDRSATAAGAAGGEPARGSASQSKHASRTRRDARGRALSTPSSSTRPARRRAPSAAIRTSPGRRARRTSASSRPCRRRLLDRAAALTKPGGRLVYCTCSLEPEEGERQAEAFLARHPDFSPVAGRARRDRRACRSAITPHGRSAHLAAAICASARQGRSGLDGFFAARFVRRRADGQLLRLPSIVNQSAHQSALRCDRESQGRRRERAWMSGPDRWRLYRLALREAGRALRERLGVRSSAWRRVGMPVPTRLLFAPQDLRTADPTIAADIYAGFFVFAGRRHLHRRALALRLRSAEPRLGRGALRLRLAAPPARRRHRARPGQCPLPRRRVHLDGRHGDRRIARRAAGARAAAHLVHQPVAADPRRRRPRLLPALPARHRPARARARAATCAPATLPLQRLIAAIALCYAGLCCEGLDGTLRRATRLLARELDGRSCRTAAMRSRNPRILIDLLFDLLPLRQMFASREPSTRRRRCSTPSTACCRWCGSSAIGDGTLAHFNGMGVTRRRPPRDAAHLRRHAQPADPARAAFRLRAAGGRRARCSSPMSAGRRRRSCRGRGRRRLPLLRVLERARSASSSIAALPAERRRCDRAGRALDRGAFDRGDRRRLLRPVPSIRRAPGSSAGSRRWLLRRLGPVASMRGPAAVGVERERDATTRRRSSRASHDGYRPLRPHPRAALAARRGGATRLDGEDLFRDRTGGSADGARR